jgi:hypothetical protein
MRTHCFHCFHIQCLAAWYQSQSDPSKEVKCPQCRNPLTDFDAQIIQPSLLHLQQKSIQNLNQSISPPVEVFQEEIQPTQAAQQSNIPKIVSTSFLLMKGVKRRPITHSDLRDNFGVFGLVEGIVNYEARESKNGADIQILAYLKMSSVDAAVMAQINTNETLIGGQMVQVVYITEDEWKLIKSKKDFYEKSIKKDESDSPTPTPKIDQEEKKETPAADLIPPPSHHRSHSEPKKIISSKTKHSKGNAINNFAQWKQTQ